MKVYVPAQSLLRILPFVSKEEVRYYLNGIFIQRHPKGGVSLVATDGHRLGVWHEEDCHLDGELPENGIILSARPEVVAVLKSKLSRAAWTGYAIIDTEKNSVAFGETPGLSDGLPEPITQTIDALVDGNYPDWLRVIPPIKDLKPFPTENGFNVQYLADFQKVCLKDKSVAIRLLASGDNDGNGPALVYLDKYPQFVGVLMPMRSTQSIEDMSARFMAASGRDDRDASVEEAA